MELSEIRRDIDAIDRELVELFCRRMALSAQVAEYKQEHDLPVYVPAREREILQKVGNLAGETMEKDTRILYSMIFELSRGYQNRLSGSVSPLFTRITQAVEQTPKLFPQSPMVACQGVEGAFSQIASEKLFQEPFLMYFKSFQGVFQAVEQGLCRYGVLPIENSTAGSVNKVYDLMRQYDFSIVRTFRMKVDHDLLARPGATLEGIREVYSHQQAIGQCGDFLAALPNAKVIPVANTAMAAELVAKSGRTDVAAIASGSCARLYGLTTLRHGIQDAGNNHTRFICISKNLEIYPGSDRTSILMVLNHKPGALYKVLSRLYTLGINVTKLESRPMPDREFEFLFYFDLETSVYSQEFARLMCELEGLCEEFKYLGSYREVV